jgi:predicted regulator of Ras-like GTPase activity (Roadblock/LC7/MglB family)
MGLDQILEKLVLRVHGALGAIFLDREGEAISQYATFPPEKLKLMGAHYAIAWLEAQGSAGRYGGSAGGELILWVEKGICLMRPLEKDYLVFLILEPSGSVGQARRWLEWALEEIRKEIES